MSRIFKPIAVLCAVALLGGSLPVLSQTDAAPPEDARRDGPGPQMMEHLADKLAQVMTELITDRNRLREMAERMATLARPNAPRDIAHDLNRESVRPPRGRRWNASTINGNAQRGAGHLGRHKHRCRLARAFHDHIETFAACDVECALLGILARGIDHCVRAA